MSEKLNPRIDAADDVAFPKSVTITNKMPMKQIYQLLAELFGPPYKKIAETDLPENKSFMEAACDHWESLRNNDPDERDPALEIDRSIDRVGEALERRQERGE